MKIGIVGLPYVGKTSLFNALTQSEAETGTYAAKKGWNVGSVKVPDERLAGLAEVFNPKRVTPTSIDYVDIAGVSKGEIALEGLGKRGSSLSSVRLTRSHILCVYLKMRLCRMLTAM